jgi:hypothetical protein
MPRGTRAVPQCSAEMHQAVHHRPVAEGTHISVYEDPLAVSCWCEADVVLVPQFDVRWLSVTRSCGRPWCRGPHGEHEVGERAPGMGWSRPRPKWLEKPPQAPAPAWRR